MGRLNRTMAAVFATAFIGTSVYASDSIELIDTTDLPEPLAQNEPWPGIATEPIRLADPLMLEDKSGPVRLTPLERLDDGVRLGVEINLNDSDQIELRDDDRLYLEADFGRFDSFAPLATDISLAFGDSVMTERGLDSVALLSRASSLALDAPFAALLLSDPQAMTPRFAGIRVGFASSERGVAPSDRGLDISVSSMLMVSAPDSGGFSYIDAASIAGSDKVFNIGLNIGYRGFTVAASFLRGTGPAFVGYESYDFGVSYDFGNWATSVAVGGYFSDGGPLSMLGAVEFDRLYSVEIGASYSLRPGIKILGRLRFFDYQTLFDTGLHGQGGSVYLGTSLGF